jgi:hypothetical protein
MLAPVATRTAPASPTVVCVECLIGKQNKPILFKVVVEGIVGDTGKGRLQICLKNPSSSFSRTLGHSGSPGLRLEHAFSYSEPLSPSARSQWYD